MYYKLRITKQEDNPKYDAQRQEYEEHQNHWSNRREGMAEIPQPIITTGLLDVVLTEEQWEAIRKGILDTYK